MSIQSGRGTEVRQILFHGGLMPVLSLLQDFTSLFAMVPMDCICFLSFYTYARSNIYCPRRSLGGEERGRYWSNGNPAWVFADRSVVLKFHKDSNKMAIPGSLKYWKEQDCLRILVLLWCIAPAIRFTHLPVSWNRTVGGIISLVIPGPFHITLLENAPPIWKYFSLIR